MQLMKYVYTILLFLLSNVIVAQSPDSSGIIITGNCYGARKAPAVSVDTFQKTGYRCVVRCTTGNGQPLLVIDGELADYASLRANLIPENIEEVHVLKSAVGTALYGYSGQNGVIVIVTKKMVTNKFYIRDFLNGAPVANATFHAETDDKKIKIDLVADENGYVVTDKLKAGQKYQISVSSVGYKGFDYSYTSRYRDSVVVLNLSRKTNVCDTVMLSPTEYRRRRGCGTIAKVIREIGISADRATKNEGLHVFPNPAAKGQVINLQWKPANENVSQVRLFTLDGKLFMSRNLPAGNKGQTQYALSTDTQMASGIYFLQLLCEKGSVIASGKVVIQ